uniref:DUF4102 domain-containing protein n=1 Tax=Heterorhabditis bacteriophora TaxID=37862 RepID=A0A1I7WS28_HETBA
MRIQTMGTIFKTKLRRDNGGAYSY